MAVSFKSIINLFNPITYSDYDSYNIFAKYKLMNKYKNDSIHYQKYLISEGDRWDLISNKFYNTPDLWWLIALFNDIKDPFQYLQKGNELKIIQPQYLSDILLAIRKVKREQSES